ncbi:MULTISPECIES: hypothetical protein [unclassified Streptomyces]|uniref:hypothetical protein n=1 Tax=unclassified Streptomyces TaxID=2593676 RepID=UPI00081F6C18|nr:MULTISPECIES: hypothetical protein [unclassified Streptomyces]MYR95434.1 hypothetical protein [Streptomyces sp. SID4937]SCD90319.1 hypothetical protein GA0115243_104714 [Streptomyces sp. ScaeMP-e83]
MNPSLFPKIRRDLDGVRTIDLSGVPQDAITVEVSITDTGLRAKVEGRVKELEERVKWQAGQGYYSLASQGQARLYGLQEVIDLMDGK